MQPTNKKPGERLLPDPRKRAKLTKKTEPAGNLGGETRFESKELPFGMLISEEQAPMSELTRKVLAQIRKNTKHHPDAAGNGDDVFAASNIKPTSPNPTQNANPLHKISIKTDWETEHAAKRVQEEGVIDEAKYSRDKVVTGPKIPIKINKEAQMKNWEAHDQLPDIRKFVTGLLKKFSAAKKAVNENEIIEMATELLKEGFTEAEMEVYFLERYSD